MGRNLIIFKIILFSLFITPLTSAYQTEYYKDKTPMFEFNDTSLIEFMSGGYELNNTFIVDKIIYFEDPAMTPVFPISGQVTMYDINVESKYIFFGRKGMSVDNEEIDILNFYINYKIKTSVDTIIPFSFDLGEWPQFLTIIDQGINTEITNINIINSSLLIYGKNKSIFFPELPPSFEYVLRNNNESTILSIIGSNVSTEGRLEVELVITEFTPLEVSRVNSFKEYSVIALENEKIKLQTDFYKDFDYPITSVVYFDDPEKTEKPFSEESSLEYIAGVIKKRKWTIDIVINDSEKILLITPFPNMVLFEPLNVRLFQSQNISAFMFDPFQIQRLSINTYENRIEILDLDRYIFPISYFEDPKITFFQNKTIIVWNYSQIETPLVLMGIVNETKSNQKIASSGNRILIVKPESKKYFSKQIVNIIPPVNKTDPPDKSEIIRYDTRYPLKSKIPIPLMLDTPSDAYVEYIKVNGNNLNGPWELNPNLALDEGKYYSFKTPKNTLSILFAVNTSNSINVELKYAGNSIENIEKVNSYTWKYSMYEFYPIGDIPDYKQIYNIILPMHYSFSDIPPNASRQRTQDGRDRIILEYNQSVRFRYLNFSISSDSLKKTAEEDKFPNNLIKFLSLSWVIENISVLILGGLFVFIIKQFNVLRKIKYWIERK